MTAWSISADDPPSGYVSYGATGWYADRVCLVSTHGSLINQWKPHLNHIFLVGVTLYYGTAVPQSEGTHRRPVRVAAAGHEGDHSTHFPAFADAVHFVDARGRCTLWTPQRAVAVQGCRFQWCGRHYDWVESGTPPWWRVGYTPVDFTGFVFVA